jgi:hypothetical protein
MTVVTAYFQLARVGWILVREGVTARNEKSAAIVSQLLSSALALPM